MATINDRNEERLRAHQADFTPAPIVRQGLEFVAARLWESGLPAPKTILDPFAGGGVFAMVAREIWPEAQITSFEAREEELPSLQRHNNITLIGDAVKLMETRAELGLKYDLIATNPPFRLIAPNEEGKVPLPILMQRLLNPTGMMVLLGQNDVGQRSKAGEKLFRDLPPAWQARICGSISFRGKGVDQRDYSFFAWQELERGADGAWQTFNLPRLPSKDRSWKVIPGTEWEHA